MQAVQNSPPNSDLLVAGINLAAAIVSFLAVLIGIAYAIASKLSKKDRPKAITIAFQIGTTGCCWRVLLRT